MSDDHNGPDGMDPSLPTSLLPYDEWLEDAQRDVMLRALEYVGENGLPGEHHFYMTFKTDYPGVDIPARLKERYPNDMTIVLQHQFQNLAIDRHARFFSVGLSFGGIPSILKIPFHAIVAFADPHIHLVLRFTPPDPEHLTSMDETTHTAPAEVHAFNPSEEPKPTPPSEAPSRKEAEVVSLAAFRKKPSTPPTTDDKNS